jgi:outer membrane protein assembly factor BamB
MKGFLGGFAACVLAVVPVIATATWAPAWTRGFASTQPLRGDFVAAAADGQGRFLVATASAQDEVGAGNARLVLLDSSGAPIAESSADLGATIRIEQVLACASGGWLVAGRRYLSARSQPFVGRVDDDGRLRWLRELGLGPLGPVVDELRIAPVGACGAVIAQQVQDTLGARSVRLASLAAEDGTPLWTQVIRPGVGPAPDFEGLAVIAVDGDALFIAGRRAGSTEAALARWSIASGQLDWVRGLGVVTDRAVNLAAANGRVLIAVLERVAGAPAGDPPVPRLLARVAATGDSAWDATEPATALGNGGLAITVRGSQLAASFGGEVVLRGAATGDLVWRATVPAVRELAIAPDGSVLVRAVTALAQAGEPALLRLAAASGQVLWELDDIETGGRAIAWGVAPAAERLLVLGADPDDCCEARLAASLRLVAVADGGTQALSIGDGMRPRASVRVLPLADGGLVSASAEWSASGARAVLQRISPGSGAVVWTSTLAIPTTPTAQWLAISALELGADGTIGVAARSGDRTGEAFGSAVAAAVSPTDGTVLGRLELPQSGGESFVQWSITSVFADAAGGLVTYAGRTTRTATAVQFDSVLQRSLGGVTAWERVSVGNSRTIPFLDAGSRVLVLDPEVGGSSSSIVALDRATGAQQWATSATVVGGGATLGAGGGVAHVVELQRIATGPARRLVARTLDLASGASVWEATLIETIPSSPGTPQVQRLPAGGLIARVFVDGITLWRLSAADGQVAWQRSLPIEPGWQAGGGRVVDFGDGRLGVTLSRRMIGPTFAAPVAFGHLAVLDAAGGALLGVHATFGAQAPGPAGAVEPPLLASLAGPPVFVHRDAELANGPIARVSALPSPSSVPGTVTLTPISRAVVGDDGRHERFTVRIDYTGGASTVSLVLRAGATPGVALSDASCTASEGANCAAAATAPALAIPVVLPSGGSATVSFDSRVAPWAEDLPTLQLGVEGDYAVNDVDLADQLRVETLRGALNADSFE